MLAKIRALLSKAEATTFVDEAEAFTAKAQDLMTRYAIDEALLEDAAGDADVIARRIHIDNPYAQAKVQLLSTVGAINRVRVVWDDDHGMASVVGMAVDLQLVEMLFTSLLVQATRALTEAGNAPPAQPGYRSGRMNRSPSFRRAFLMAYATRSASDWPRPADGPAPRRAPATERNSSRCWRAAPRRSTPRSIDSFPRPGRSAPNR